VSCGKLEALMNSSDARSQQMELILTVYLPAALLAFGQGLLLTTLPLYISSLNVSYSLVSLVVGASALGTLLMDIPAGALVGRLGLRPTMLVGTILVGIGTLALSFFQDIPLLVAARIAAGVGTALWGISRHAYVATAIPIAMRGRAISIYGGVNRIGTFAGPAAGGVLAGWVSYQASFVAASLMAAIVVCLTLFLIKPSPLPLEASGGRGRWRVVGVVLRQNRRDLGAAAVAQTFAQMIRAGRLFIVPLYGSDVLDLDPAKVGLVLTVSAVLDVSMFVPAGFLMDRFGRKTAAVPSFAIMAVGVAMIPLATSFAWLLVAAAVIGFGNGLGSGTMMTLGADLAPEGATGEFLGVWRLIGDAGAFVGPVAVGLLASAVGLRGSAILLAVFGAIAALTLAFMVRETRQSPVPASG
jgi:MFS family permease